jgi:hypothetical protein
MDRFIDRIRDKRPELAAHLIGPAGKNPDGTSPLVVVDAEKLRGPSFYLHALEPQPSPVGCSPGRRRVFVEFGEVPFLLESGRPSSSSRMA